MRVILRLDDEDYAMRFLFYEITFVRISNYGSARTLSKRISLEPDYQVPNQHVFWSIDTVGEEKELQVIRAAKYTVAADRSLNQNLKQSL